MQQVALQIVHPWDSEKGVRECERDKRDEFDETDYDDDGIAGEYIDATERIPNSVPSDMLYDTSRSAKYSSDKARVMKFLKGFDDMSDVKKARFLFISMQTYGNFDGECIPAELGLCEFNLSDGIIYKFSSSLGPWRIINVSRRSRAAYHAEQTHRIPISLSAWTRVSYSTKNACVREIMQRCKPPYDRAAKSVVTSATSKRSVAERIATTPSNGISEGITGQHRVSPPNNVTQESAIVAGGRTGERWLVCLQHEYRDILASLNFLKKAQRVKSSAFPANEDRFIFADSLIDAVAMRAKGSPRGEYKGWMELFGKPQPNQVSTPWERRANVYCKNHSAERNCCCAAATATRGCFAIFYALHDLLELPFGD